MVAIKCSICDSRDIVKDCEDDDVWYWCNECECHMEACLSNCKICLKEVDDFVNLCEMHGIIASLCDMYYNFCVQEYLIQRG